MHVILALTNLSLYLSHASNICDLPTQPESTAGAIAVHVRIAMQDMHAIDGTPKGRMKTHANQEHTSHQAIPMGVNPATRAIIVQQKHPHQLNTFLVQLEHIQTGEVSSA